MKTAPLEPHPRSRPIPGWLSKAVAGPAREIRRVRWALSVALISLVGGCVEAQPKPKPKPSPSQIQAGPIREINLLAMPSALNLDEKPGADGVAVKVFALRQGASVAGPIESGALEIMVFAGTYDESKLVEPFRTWRFEPKSLKQMQIKSLLGVGYYLVLDWRPLVLTGTRSTVVARYIPDYGAPITSAPSYVVTTSL